MRCIHIAKVSFVLIKSLDSFNFLKNMKMIKLSDFVILLNL
jgi:hypothetical protein